MSNVLHHIPAIVLTGGRSTRMGNDKFLLDYGRGPQWRVMLDLLQQHFREVYISCRPDQVGHFAGQPCVTDRWTDIGPMAGIASALRQLSDAPAVFVVGCDLPFFDPALADMLVAQNDSSGIACCARVVLNEFPEPLVAVWNRCALEPMEKAIAQKEYSLQRLLKQHSYREVNVTNERWLFNANTPGDIMRMKE